jgi:hypothetical protein
MSGLKEVDAAKLATVDAIVAAAMREPLGYEPGTRSTYGFTDYVVLARIMERFPQNRMRTCSVMALPNHSG